MGKSGRLDAKEKAFFFCGDEEDEPLLACSCDGGSREVRDVSGLLVGQELVGPCRYRSFFLEQISLLSSGVIVCLAQG